MNEARNYQGRAPKTHPYNSNLNDSESRVSPPSTSSSGSDESEVVSASSSRVSEEHESYCLINSKSLLSNDELLNMLSKDQNFIQSCKDKNISKSDIHLLKDDFNQYKKKYTSYTQSEIDRIDEKKSLVIDAKAMPKDNGCLAQLKTTGLAGASAYWTSFMLGKLATNIVSTSTGSTHGVWPSLLIAGLLNPLVSEPLANAIRLQGAHHTSPDGKAYMDFHSALQELHLAEKNKQNERINECHAFIFKIINECIEREKLMGCLQSGVDEIKNEDINDLENTYGNIQNVIRSAQRRAFITDELPFFWYTFLYTFTGAASPFIKQSFSPWIAAGIDFAVHASAGTIAGSLTGISQNYLRKLIQKSALQNFSADIKGAQLALAAAQRDPWNEKLINLKKLLNVLKIEKDNLQSTSEQDGEDDKLEALNQLIKDLNKETKHVETKWKQARSVHSQHESRLKRIQTAVLDSGKSYMGEVSNIDNPGLLEGAPAQASMCAKLIAVPLSLSLSCFHMALVIPALLNSGHTNATNVQGMNFTEFGDIGIEQPASLFEPTATISPGANAAYALAGVPLILGFITRYLFLHPYIQYWIRPIYGASGTVADSRKNDTVVNVQNTFAESEDDSENDEYEGSSYEESSSSPTTPRKINKSNTLNKQNKRSENYNEDGGSSEDSNSFESSRTRSSYV